MKTILLLAAAALGGYYYGFHDAKSHDRPVIERMVDGTVARTGGSNRKKVGNDIDAQMSSAER